MALLLKAMEIKIAEPCHENWEAMTPQESGKHCTSCSKTVHDFTQSSREELLSFLLCSEQRPCIRMLSSQQQFTSREVQYTARKLLRSGVSVPAAALSLLLIFANSSCTSENTATAPGAATVPAGGGGNRATGMVVPVTLDTPLLCRPEQTSIVQGEPSTPVLMGDIAIAPSPTLMGVPPFIEPPVADSPQTPPAHQPEIMGRMAMPAPPKDSSKR